MNRANPKDLREALETAHEYAKVGILFVPVPVLDDSDRCTLWLKAAERFEQLAQASEQEAP